MARTGFLMILAGLAIISSSDASQLIRLQNGYECPMPGFFRDMSDCQKFYYCPEDSNAEKPINSDEEKVLNEIKSAGLRCPEGSIFDETLRHCERLEFLKSISPECLPSPNSVQSSSHSKTGDISEVSNNH